MHFDLNHLDEIWDSLSIDERTRIMGELSNDQWREFEAMRSRSREAALPGLSERWNALNQSEQEWHLENMTDRELDIFTQAQSSSSPSQSGNLDDFTASAELESLLNKALSPFNADDYLSP